jgi:hypothetical protein
MIALIQTLMVVVGLLVTLTAQGASSHKEDERKGYAHDGNKIKGSSTPTPSAHDEEIRKGNDRALAVSSASPQATTYAAVPSISSILKGGLIAFLFLGVLGFLGYGIIAGISEETRLATPPVTTLSVSQLQFQTASLNALRHRVVPHYYQVDDFFRIKEKL